MSTEPVTQLRPIFWPHGWSAERIALLSAKEFGCVILSGPAPEVAAAAAQAGLRTVQLTAAGLPAPDGVTVVSDGVWAKIVRSRDDPTSTEAGPTGLPWIDSNGWRIQLARAQSHGKIPWVRFSPPPKEVLRAGAYQIALADSEANGGRWVVELDSELSRGIASGNRAAREAWSAILRTVAFYRDRPSPPQAAGAGARMGVLSDFTGQNELISHEFLNLIAREYVPVRILMSPDAPAPLDGLRLVIYLDTQPMPAVWARALAAFVDAGGTLVTMRSADPKLGGGAPAIPGLEYQIRTAGKGKVAVSLEDFDDPWRVAADAHVLLGRSHDLVRHANAGSMNITYAASPDGRRARLELVSYSLQRALNPVTLTLHGQFSKAMFRSCASPAPATVPLAIEYGRTAIYLPHFTVCATVDLQA
ncbi:MAG: hypothetical protein IPJ98_26850 [Bryobacterales bacterium]|nr:hypothetical protein [Bryobacterales bacterium]